MVVVVDAVMVTGVVMIMTVYNLSSVYLETKMKTKRSYSPR